MNETKRQTHGTHSPVGLLTVTLLTSSVMLCAGCPDYSHLRVPPDYSSQQDGHGGDPEAEREARISGQPDTMPQVDDSGIAE